MCVSLKQAILTQTIAMAYATHHPKSKQPIVVLGYQMNAENQSAGGNAMLLHVPASVDIGPENMLDTSQTPRVLEDIAKAVRPVRNRFMGGDDMLRSASFGRKASVQVFDHGDFTIVMSQDIRAAHEALARVREDRRPEIPTETVDFYANTLHDQRFMFWCWSGKASRKAPPIMFWYEPSQTNTLFVPGIDAHDGKAPDLGAYVELDHTFAAGHFSLDFNSGASFVEYSDGIPAELRPFLPRYVKGQSDIRGRYKNGDFAVRVEQLLRPEPISILRWQPKHGALPGSGFYQLEAAREKSKADQK